MQPISYARHQFPPDVIQRAIWLYLRFTLSYRDVKELLAARGVDVSYKMVRRWVPKFGPAIARRLREAPPIASSRWHLDQMVVRIAGQRMYLWLAVDDEGEVLDVLVQRRRNRAAAQKLMCKLLKTETWKWLQRGSLKRETESLIVVAQDQALRTNYRRARIEKSTNDPKC